MSISKEIQGEWRKTVTRIVKEFPVLKLEYEKTRGGHIRVKSGVSNDVTFVPATPSNYRSSGMLLRQWCRQVAKDLFRNETIERTEVAAMPSHGYGSWH